MTDFLPVTPTPAMRPAMTDTSLQTPDRTPDKARLAAEKLEATFLAEMLKSAGFGEQKNSFSGSAGEEHFGYFHRQAIAEQIASSGGIGLAEHILRHMTGTRNDD